MFTQRFIIIVLLVIFSAALFLTGISKSALWEEDEVWYAQVSREISTSGDFATLTFGGEPFFHKPPLFYWAEAICGKAFGFSEVSVRMVSVVSAVLTVVLTFLIGELLFSTEVGALAGVILATSFQYFIQAKLAYLEPLLVFFMALAVYFFIKGYFKDKPAYYIWFYVAASLATLTKGPIGILLPAGAIFLFLALQKEWRQIICVFFNWGLLLFAVIVPPWYIIETLKFGPSFLMENIGYHQVTRFAKGAETHAEPWYYNFVSLFLGFLPWSTFVPAGLLFAARRIKQKPILLLVLWAGVIFVFFTISVSKLPGYLLPVFVPLSILVAAMLAAFWKEEDGVTGRGIFSSFLFLVLLLLSLAAMFFYVVAAKGPMVTGGFGVAIGSLRPLAYLLGGGALAGLAAFLLKPKKA
ncbi:MAG: glycosyltransferase family 39 protein, partial [Candidatus Margulisiibacteriota bacterium]